MKNVSGHARATGYPVTFKCARDAVKEFSNFHLPFSIGLIPSSEMANRG